MINLCTHLCYASLLMAMTFSCGASPKSNSLDDVDGYYTAPSHLCTEKKGNALKSCKHKFVDCLVIRKKSQTSAEFELLSTQANQHVCAARGSLNQVGNLLEASNEGGGVNEGLSIRVERDELVVDYKKPEVAAAGICGAHAALKGLTFKRLGKRASGPICFKD